MFGVLLRRLRALDGGGRWYHRKFLISITNVERERHGFLLSGTSRRVLKIPNLNSSSRVAEKYQRLTPLKHVLYRPDSYIGSAFLSDEQSVYVYDANRRKIIRREAKIVPGLLKIFDEILVNAADNKRRDPQMSTINVTIDREANMISVWNNGKGIPIEIHPTEGIYIPTLIFGSLFTSSNYDDSEIKIVGGRNGFGAKLCNIFSTKFSVETCDKDAGLQFSQQWTCNMSEVGDPIVKEVSNDAVDFTCVSFEPDLCKFKLTELDQSTVDVMMRRVVDVAGTLDGVQVFLNGSKIEVNGFNDYVMLYSDENSLEFKNSMAPIYLKMGDRWEIALGRSDNGFQQISFVNNISTLKGGRHVDYIVSQVINRIKVEIEKKNGKSKYPSSHQVRNRLSVFVNALIENPSFESQSKEFLTTTVKNFGSNCVIPENLYEQFFLESDIIENLIKDISRQQEMSLNRSLSHKLMDLPKLEDASDAGTVNSNLCTLIVTEGDSAKALAVAGLAVVGRQRYGVFPLRGRLTNVRGFDAQKVIENPEISAIVRILGLKFGEDYSGDAIQLLRYGRLLMMTDQDPDGSHIKGLVINFLHTFWPSLLRREYVQYFMTPLLKAKKASEIISFYSMLDFISWQKITDNSSKYSIKYYKGLGTSSAKEAREYFSDIDLHTVKITHDEKADEAIDLFFNKDKADDRKLWIETVQNENEHGSQIESLKSGDIDPNIQTVTQFINGDLLEYSRLDLRRSLPNVVDGLKPSQRKVMMTMFDRFERSEVRVSQLAGAVSQFCAYHHGEESLINTIVRLAQDYVGSNNINLLQPIGQFGTRLTGGNDAASARYIYTALNPVTRVIFPQADDVVLKYIVEENMKIEPEWYCPIIPMILINGAEGIGTGWATKILPRSPKQVIENTRRLIDGKPLNEMIPFFRNFRGKVAKIGPNRYITTGLVTISRIKSGFKAQITELPVGVWNSKYKERVLDPLVKNGSIRHFEEFHTESTIDYAVEISEKHVMEERKQLMRIRQSLKLDSVMSENSMVSFDEKYGLRKFDTVEEIFHTFFNVRRQKYEERISYQLKLMDRKCKIVRNQVRFIDGIVRGDIKIQNKTRSEIITQLIEAGIEPQGMLNEKSQRNATDFAYLLEMPLLRLSQEEVEVSNRKLNALQMQYDELKTTTWKSLWFNELDTLVKALKITEFD